MASARDIRRRIKGVKSTGKITRAMEMISAVKMRKAVGAVLAIRPYAKGAIDLLKQLSVAVGNEEHPLMIERPVKRELYVVITSNRGLCGAFNTQIGKKLRQTLYEDVDRGASFVTIGKKGEMMVRRILASRAGNEGDIIASFPDALVVPSPDVLRPVARIIQDEFESGRIDRVVMLYTDYVSVMTQMVKVRALLPVAIKDTKKALNEMGREGEEKGERGERGEEEGENDEKGIGRERGEEEGEKGGTGVRGGRGMQGEYLIEPSPKKVLWRMIPRLLEMELYHAVLESNASQESARMLAMKNATDAAKEMVDDLTLTYNQIRQGKITQEIAELSAGMAAVSR